MILPVSSEWSDSKVSSTSRNKLGSIQGHALIASLDMTVWHSELQIGCDKVSAPRSGCTRLDPGSQHSKVVKQETSCLPLGTRIFGVGLQVGLVAPVLVLRNWGSINLY